MIAMSIAPGDATREDGALGAEEATMVEPVADPSPGDATREAGDARMPSPKDADFLPYTYFASADCGAQLSVRVGKRFTFAVACACKLCSSAEGPPRYTQRLAIYAQGLARQASAASA
jgi:hypothetical protein